MILLGYRSLDYSVCAEILDMSRPSNFDMDEVMNL